LRDLADACEVKPAAAVQAAVAVCQQSVAAGAAGVKPAALGALPMADADLGFVDEPADWRLSVKRVLDVALCIAALVVSAPLFLAIAALIKLTDGGPIFFAQRRVGLGGRTFQMLKFRSMVVDAEQLKPSLAAANESNGPVFKMQRDPRVTAVGRFIRRYSIDELPQLVNVLLGDMSVVGPRPSLPAEVARYKPWQHRRFAVRPGLTCLWQTSPGRYRIPFDEWMRLDLKYIEQWSLALDLLLILRTVRVVVTGTGE
jgi:lipopolysaccharide/colanic/teichoic acid biosynthesis glycosyltransferase